MKHRYALGLLLAMSLVSAVPRAHAETPRVILSEIAWAGSQKSTADEWIELANLEAASISVGGWQLTGVGTGGSALTLPDSATIAAGGTYLVANYNIGSSSTLLAAPDYVTTAVSIPNTALNVSLLDQHGTVIDMLLDPGTPNAGSSTTFATMERSLADSSWVTAETSNNLLNGQFGSPGIAGHVAVPTVENPPSATTSIPTSTITEPPPTSNPVTSALAVESSVSEMHTETETPVAAPISETANGSSSVIATETSEAPVVTSGSVPVPHLLISAFLAAPNTGENEWIEITNAGTDGIDLEGYSLIDATGKATSLSGTLAVGGSVVITDPKGTLNNDGDLIAILDASGATVTEVTYGTEDLKAPKKNVVLRYEHGAWVSESGTEIIDPVVDEPIQAANSVPVTATPPAISEPVSSEVTSPSSPVEDTNAVSSIIETVSASTPTQTSAMSSEDTPSTSDVVSSSAAVINAGDLVISALLPAPATGDDEWIAITNTTASTIDLSAVSVTDASGAETTLNGSVDAGATVYVTNPNGKLNNDGDTVSLLSSGSILDVVTYGTDDLPTPKKGETLTFTDYPQSSSPALSPTLTYESSSLETPATTEQSSSTVTTASPRHTSPHENAVASASSTNTSTHSVSATTPRVSTTSSGTSRSTSRGSRSSTSISPKNTSIDGIDQLADDTAVTLEGIVIATPGMIGRRSFFLDGLEVYQNQGALAAVSIGDRVRITGTVSVLSDHRRVNIKEGSVTVLGTATPVTHDYSEGLRYGSLTRVAGTVSARSGNDAILAFDNGTQLTLTSANGVSVPWSDLAGKHIAVAGILKSTTEKTSLVLRSAEDILVDSLVTQESSANAVQASASSFPWLGISFAALTGAGLGFWFWKTRPPSSKTLGLKSSVA